MHSLHQPFLRMLFLRPKDSVRCRHSFIDSLVFMNGLLRHPFMRRQHGFSMQVMTCRPVILVQL